MLLNIRHNYGSVTADELNMMDTCVKHKVPQYGKVYTVSESAVHRKFESIKKNIHSIIFQRWTAPQTIAGQSNLHLPWDLLIRSSGNSGCRAPFSLIQIRCQLERWFEFCDFPPSSQCCYTLTVWLCLWDCSKSNFWAHVICQLLGKYHWPVCQGMQFLF